MTDEATNILVAMRREIDALLLVRIEEPVRIRVTRASLQGSLLVMPEDVTPFILREIIARDPRREIRVHPADWAVLIRHARKISGRAGAGITELYGLPILVEQGCGPEEWEC